MREKRKNRGMKKKKIEKQKMKKQKMKKQKMGGKRKKDLKEETESENYS